MSLLLEQVVNVSSIDEQSSSGSLATGVIYKSSLLKAQTASYSFARHGGAIGAILLPLPYSIPVGSVIREVIINSTSALTSAGAATVSIGVKTAAEFVAAAAFTAGPFNGNAGSLPPVAAPACPVSSAVISSVIVTVGAAALTGGAFTATVLYLEGVSTSI